jgi:WS/DGAT/MGAT family acyltransferase
MKQLTGLDASFVYLDQSNSPMHIGSVAIYDPSTSPNGFVRFKEILQFIEDRLHLAETFRQKLVRVPFGMDHPYWIEDKDFDIEYHVRHVALPSPGDWRQLCILSARLFARPLDLNRPPWELTVVEGLDNVEGVPPGSYAIVSKVHHCAIDGMSGVDIMNAIHTLEPDVSPPDTKDDWKPESAPSTAEMLFKGYVGNLRKPFRFLDVAAKSVPGVARVAKGLVTREFGVESLFKVPRTRFNKSVSPHRVVDGRIFPLKDIQAIKCDAGHCWRRHAQISGGQR